MTRAFQIAYVNLDTPDAQQALAPFDRMIGATPAEREHKVLPQRPRVWTIDQLTTWGTHFGFDLKAA